MTKAEAGRLGGLKTASKGNIEHLKRIAKLGGRPKSLSLQELRVKCPDIEL